MPTTTQRENLAVAYGAAATYAALFTSATTGTSPRSTWAG